MRPIKMVSKVIGAGLVAVVILSVLLAPYYYAPLHYENPSHNTDYVWKANSLWANLKEGFSFGRFDARGYNNYKVIDDPDIIVLGSSHIQGGNIMQGDNLSNILSTLFAGKYTVYNMGISGHTIYKVSKYLPANLSQYITPPRVVIIETSTVIIDNENVEKVLNGTVDYTPSHTSGLLASLQKIPFFRLLYTQAEGGLLDLFLGRGGISTITGQEPALDQSAYDKFFDYLEAIQNEYGTKIIILYHPRDYVINVDGTVSFNDSSYLRAFSQGAKEHSVSFVDMTENFKALYNEEHKLPHGFANGEVGVGHLNAVGHRRSAQALYEEIEMLEENGVLCK